MTNTGHLIDTTKNMLRRELTVRYAGSFLGPFWSVLYPVIFTLITATIFSSFFNKSIEGIPYFLYVLIGFNCWFWFNLTISNATRSIINNRELIVNNKFPSESIIFSIVGVRLVDHIINFSLLVILLLLINQKLTLTGILLIVYISSCQLLLQTGISLITASLNAYVRDLQNFVDILLQLAFYSTPIIYSTSILPDQLQKIALFNPLAIIVISYRNAIFNRAIQTEPLAYILLVSGFTFLLGYIIYKKLENKFAELI
jgi:ABC-type polysaccharide/polyol phosphate export permease